MLPVKNCPACNEENELCEVCTVAIDVPSRSPKEIRDEQMKDEELVKIISCLEDPDKNVYYVNWVERSYLMNQGVLFRYAPDSESEEAQLVIPSHERTLILKTHHDAPMAGHYGAEGTYTRIEKNYYWTGMRKYITDYVKNCPDCIKYKASNQKPSGLLQTPVPAQRFETLAIDLFGPLPESKDGKRFILIIEDCTTKWVELFAPPNATAKECAIILIEEVLLSYGIPRRLISDNAAVMQQICYLLNIHQSLIPVYHPQANPVERKKRYLKPRLEILDQDKHDCWLEKLPFIRFALNTAKCKTTGQTAAFLNFCRELRTPSEVVNDIRVVIQSDNFMPEIIPCLMKFTKFFTQIREVVEEQQNSRKFYADKKRKTAPAYQPGEHVFVASHPLSNAAQGRNDSAALTQGVNLKYTIKTVQHFLIKLEKCLTDWRIALNVEKTQAIVFRKWGVIDPQTELTLFDDNIQWVPVVRDLGLYIDSRLTYKNHVDYRSDKFWGRIALAISLLGEALLSP
ncbi:retrovirus-related Pol polyprotein from transposon 412 [Trichonephila clavipes]|nr:retrovirus-related Pol polyprotein from transposon 412 [Trichonephila clavipes]